MPTQAQKARGGIARTHQQPGIRRIQMISITFQPLYPQERAGTSCKRLGWPRVRSECTENLASTGIRSTDPPARSELFSYQLHHKDSVSATCTPSIWYFYCNCLFNIVVININVLQRDGVREQDVGLQRIVKLKVGKRQGGNEKETGRWLKLYL